MPRSRGSEMPVRQQTPKGPIPAPSRTTRSDSDPSHLRPIKDRTSRLADRRSPVKSEPVNQKKLGTRIADLESQLGSAQTELKILKDQLASAEEAKRLAQDQLEKKVKKSVDNDNDTDNNNNKHESQPETDVFEVPIETVQNRVVHIEEEPLRVDDGLALKDDEISLLRARLEEKEKELESIHNENNAMKEKLDELNSEMATVKTRETETTLRLGQLEKELNESNADGNRIREKIEAMEASREAVEAEMKKMRVQTEQWRKAADAAAAMLSGGVMEMNGRRRISERCGSMEGQYRGGGSMGYEDEDDDDDDDLEEDRKRKGSSSGIRMFGDLWRKKGQK